MAPWWNRRSGGHTNLPDERKSQSLFALSDLANAQWSTGGFASLSRQGFARNPIVYRCVRMIAEAATRVPLSVVEGGQKLTEHPVLSLLNSPNAHQSGPEFMERIFAYLQTAGNAYIEAALVDEQVRALYDLRPDRMQVIAGKDGWPVAYGYTTNGKTRRLSQVDGALPKVLHLKLFHPMDDHYGLAPLEAARTSLDIHNAAANWNKSLLDNAARPSGALVYSAATGNLSADQFKRLKAELEQGFQGASNAGRPMVLEGGLDWKNMALSPKDMDFIEAKNSAAREIALAFGVPPMLLGIPGDNTYANYAEANRVLWRQAVVPLVRRVAASLGHWLQPAFGGAFEIVPELGAIEALGEERAALWKRVSDADFLTDDEKRTEVGLAPAAGR